jgi:hypothetical protein
MSLLTEGYGVRRYLIASGLGMVEAVIPGTILVLNGNMATTTLPAYSLPAYHTSLQKLPTQALLTYAYFTTVVF